MMRRIIATFASVLVSGGCHRDRPIEEMSAEGSAGEASIGEPSGETAIEPSASAGTVDGDSGSSGGTTSTGSTDASSTSSGDEPFPEECYEPEALIQVDIAETPDGTLQVDEAWLGVDACSGPYVTLAQLPSATGPGLEVNILFHDPDTGDIYDGVYAAHIIGGGSGTVEVFEPIGPFDGGPNPENRLHARIEIHDEGWDLSVEVELIDCGVGACFCPCE